MIDSVKNTEMKRVMVELYGIERWIQDSGIQAVHKDDWGELYQPIDLRYRLVKVTNSTPEPDGSKKLYWLKVPPTVRTAREAVAWLNWKQPEAYAPSVET